MDDRRKSVIITAVIVGAIAIGVFTATIVFYGG
jgi:hypothetical protein